MDDDAPSIIFEKKESNTFDIEIEHKKYKFKISYIGSHIELLITDSNSLLKQEYYIKKSLKDLQLDLYFQQFENLFKIQEKLIELQKENKLNIIKDEKNNIFRIIFKNQANNNDVIIDLPKKEMNAPEQIENVIVPFIVQLQEKLSKLEQENDLLKKRVAFLELFDESNILNIYHKKNLIKWLPENLKTTQLIYDTKIHGDTVDDFKNKCEGINPTVAVIKTTEGVIFGGYTNVKWQEEGPFEDHTAFIFSFNPDQKYENTDSLNAVCGYSNDDHLLFQFGTTQFCIKGECTKNNDSYFQDFDESSSNTQYRQGEINIIEGQNFQVDRLEIFKLNY